MCGVQCRNVVETFSLREQGDTTLLTYDGELATDLWGLGRRWGDVVAPRWEAVVAESFAAVKTEAERRALISNGDEARTVAG